MEYTNTVQKEREKDEKAVVLFVGHFACIDGRLGSPVFGDQAVNFVHVTILLSALPDEMKMTPSAPVSEEVYTKEVGDNKIWMLVWE